MRWIVDGCYLLAAGIAAPLIAYRAWRTGKYRRDWGQRFGHVPELVAGRQRVWIHAVSMGEMNSIAGLVGAWRQRDPDVEFVISATTDTGIDRARKLFPDLTVIRYPLDFSWVISRALDRIRPRLIVLVELEVWYQFVTLATARGIPVAVINGRITESKSLRRFRWVLGIVRRMFRSLTWVGAQDETYAERFQQVGVPPDRVSVTGSIKWDSAQIADSIPGTDELGQAMGLDRKRPVWVCGSTGGPMEEGAILEAFSRIRERHPGVQLVIVPRKPERFNEVAERIRRAGFTCIRRSECPDGASTAAPGGAVHLGDTMGELRKFYSLADVVFIGRTLEPMGGSDMMEVAALGKPVVVGPYTGNFADTMQQLQRADAVVVVEPGGDLPDSSKALAEAIDGLLANPQRAQEMGQRGREVVGLNRGATERTLTKLIELLNHSGANRPAHGPR